MRAFSIAGLFSAVGGYRKNCGLIPTVLINTVGIIPTVLNILPITDGISPLTVLMASPTVLYNLHGTDDIRRQY